LWNPSLNSPAISLVEFSLEFSRNEQNEALSPSDAQLPSIWVCMLAEGSGSILDLLSSLKQLTLSLALCFLISLARIMVAAHPANIF
jgi:hypothetical protein